MILGTAMRRQGRGGRAPVSFWRELATPAGRTAVWPWLIVGGVSIILGLATSTLSSFPPRLQPLLVVALICPFLALLVSNLRKLLLAVIILDVPLQLDANFGYRTEAARLGAIGGLDVSVTTVCLVVLYTLWFCDLMARTGHLPHPRLRESLPAALYVAFVALSLTAAHDVTLAIFELFTVFQVFLLFLYVASVVRTRDDVTFVMTMLLIGLTLEGLLMIVTRLTGYELRLPGSSNPEDVGIAGSGDWNRSAGSSGSPNATAAYLTLLLAPTLGLLATRLGRGYKQLAIGAFTVGATALAFTLSRGGWASFAVSVGVLCLMLWRRGWFKPTLPVTVGGIVVVLIAAGGLHELIALRLLGDDQGSAHARGPLMQLAFRMIEDYPLLGIGANNFAIMIERYATPEFDVEWLYVVHNKYLLVWAETGVGGLIAFLGFLLVTLRRAWGRGQSGDPLLAPLALGLTAALIGHTMHMFVDLFSNGPQVQALWLIAGLIVAMSQMDDGPAAAGRGGATRRRAGHEPGSTAPLAAGAVASLRG